MNAIQICLLRTLLTACFLMAVLQSTDWIKDWMVSDCMPKKQFDSETNNYINSNSRMAPTYKLQYFNVKALGEPIRFLLSYGGAKFEDERFEEEQWPEIKPRMPFGKAPVLEVDGKLTHQSSAICRYLAKQYGLAGANDWESMQIDSVVDTFTDFRMELYKFFFDEEDEVVKEAKKGPILANVVPYYLAKFEQLVKDNGGFFHGGKLSWADLYWVGISDFLSHMVGGRVSDGYPSLRALEDKVLALPPIAAWVAGRPPTDM